MQYIISLEALMVIVLWKQSATQVILL